MLIDIVRSENWDELNDDVREFLKLSNKNRVRCYKGLSQSLFEITQGTAHFMAHKKSVGFVMGMTPLFEGLLPYYLKEAYNIQKTSRLGLENTQEWVDSLNKDTAFVVFCEDHPVTGELFPYTDVLDRMLNDKRIYSIRLSHQSHFFSLEELRPFSVRLCSYRSDDCVAILGERFKSPSLLAHQMNWQKEVFLKDISSSAQERQCHVELVKNFENEITTIGRSFLSEKMSRTFDRAVVVLSEVSAEAVAQRLFLKLNISTHEGWRHIETTNMCRWSTVSMFQHWWEAPPSAGDLRGMLVIDAKMLKTKDFTKLLISSYEEVKAEQSWNV